MEEKSYVICARTDRHARPHVLSYRSHCVRCKFDVWRAYTSPAIHETLCMECAEKSAREGEPIEIQGPTEKQLREIEEHSRRSNN
jgi:recombinational DNA repair protein (RecF pathway)